MSQASEYTPFGVQLPEYLRRQIAPVAPIEPQNMITWSPTASGGYAAAIYAQEDGGQNTSELVLVKTKEFSLDRASVQAGTQDAAQNPLSGVTIIASDGGSSFLQLASLSQRAAAFNSRGPVSGQQFTVAHGLGRTPVLVLANAYGWPGYMFPYQSPDATNIYLESNVVLTNQFFMWLAIG